jgi:hypothetical protein
MPGHDDGGPGALPGLPGGKGGVAFGLSRSGDKFTARYQGDGAKIVLRGERVKGKDEVKEIEIEGKGTYKSVDKVPKDYQEKVKELIEMTTKGPFHLKAGKGLPEKDIGAPRRPRPTEPPAPRGLPFCAVRRPVSPTRQRGAL